MTSQSHWIICHDLRTNVMTCIIIVSLFYFMLFFYCEYIRPFVQVNVYLWGASVITIMDMMLAKRQFEKLYVNYNLFMQYHWKLIVAAFNNDRVLISLKKLIYCVFMSNWPTSTNSVKFRLLRDMCKHILFHVIHSKHNVNMQFDHMEPKARAQNLTVINGIVLYKYQILKAND